MTKVLTVEKIYLLIYTCKSMTISEKIISTSFIGTPEVEVFKSQLVII